MTGRLNDELQVRLNKLVRTEDFRKFVLKYVSFLPNDFNISLTINDRGEIAKIDFGIVHYGYENSYNKGLSIYDDLNDFWTAPSDPVISPELKQAATEYLNESTSLISDLLVRFIRG